MATEPEVEEWQSDPTLDAARADLWRAMREWIHSDKGANTTLPQFHAYARAAYNLGRDAANKQADRKVEGG